MTDSNERETVCTSCGAMTDGLIALHCAHPTCPVHYARAAAPQAQPSEQQAAKRRISVHGPGTWMSHPEVPQAQPSEPAYAPGLRAAFADPQAQPAPAGQPFVPLSMPELLRRVERARQFPVNTCPASRHVHLMACALAIRQPYAMLTDEPQHCAESMLYVLASLWEARTEIERLARSPEPAPIDMVLHCPNCGKQHVDAPEIGYSGIVPGPYQARADWTNPPHRSHLCHGCGHVWRPADVPTNGVQAVKTTGKNDSPITEPAPISDSRIIEIRDSLLPSQGEPFDCIAFARVVLAERMAPK